MKPATPKLRFKEFSDEWQEKRLGDVTTWFSGGTPSKDNPKYWGGTIPWISASSMHGSEYSNSDRTITGEGVSNGSKIAPKGSILLLVRGSMLFNTIPVGIAAKDVAFNQDVKAITSEKLNERYLLYFFQSSEPKLLSKVVGTGIGAGKLDMDDLPSMEIAVPSAQEQQKIADFLTAVDEKIEKLEAKKAHFAKYQKGVMQEIFPPCHSGLDPESRNPKIRFKKPDGSDYPDWEERKLCEVAQFLKGSNISKEDISEGGKTECILYGELYTKYHECITNVHSKTDLDQKGIVLGQQNDVLIPSSGETNVDIATASCVLKDSIALGGDINIIRTKQDGVFLVYYLNHAKRYDIARLAQGISVVHLYSSQLKLLKVELPILEEQQKIAEFLTSLNKKIDLITKELEQAKLFKKALLQGMFV